MAAMVNVLPVPARPTMHLDGPAVGGDRAHGVGLIGAQRGEPGDAPCSTVGRCGRAARSHPGVGSARVVEWLSVFEGEQAPAGPALLPPGLSDRAVAGAGRGTSSGWASTHAGDLLKAPGGHAGGQVGGDDLSDLVAGAGRVDLGHALTDPGGEVAGADLDVDQFAGVAGRRSAPTACCRRRGWVGCRARASIESVVNPTAAASAAHRSRSVSGSTSTLAVRVASMASAAAAAPSTPAAAIAASISERRFENAAITSAGTPATSARPLPAGRHATPSRAVSSCWRAVRNTAPAVCLARYRPWASSADQRPSGPRVRLATRTWVCRWGSPARLVRCRNAAATNPAPRSRRVPNSARHPSPWPGCWTLAGRSRPRVPARRRPRRRPGRRPPSTSDTTSGSPRAYRTDTDFGDGERQVEPGHPALPRAGGPPFGDCPVPGCSPASTARSSSRRPRRRRPGRARRRPRRPSGRASHRDPCSSPRGRGRPGTGSSPRRRHAASRSTSSTRR